MGWTDQSILPDNVGFDTFPRQGTLCVAVHTLTCLARLQFVVPLVSRENIEVFWTQVPDQLGEGVAAMLAASGEKVIPWERATGEYADVALGASLHRMEELPARRRIAIPHGGGYNKRWPHWNWTGPEAVPPVYGLDGRSLLHDGVPVFDAILLTHEDQRGVLHLQCPEAEPTAFVGGDIVYDSLLEFSASTRTRRSVRRALGLLPGQRLVVLASTFGPDSLLHNYQDRLAELLEALPARYRAVLVMHSGVWSQHGRQNALGRLHRAMTAGLRVVDAGEDWRGLVLAADAVISDASSIGLYGAAVGVPLLMTPLPPYVLDSRSAIGELARHSSKLIPDIPLIDQLRAAQSKQPILSAIARRRVSSAPGHAAALLRAKLYELLELPEPPVAPVLPPIKAPTMVNW